MWYTSPRATSPWRNLVVCYSPRSTPVLTLRTVTVATISHAPPPSTAASSSWVRFSLQFFIYPPFPSAPFVLSVPLLHDILPHPTGFLWPQVFLLFISLHLWIGFLQRVTRLYLNMSLQDVIPLQKPSAFTSTLILLPRYVLKVFSLFDELENSQSVPGVVLGLLACGCPK